MDVTTVLVVVWAFLGVVPAVILLLGTLTLERRCPLLAKLTPKEPAMWPKLSVIIPACNEAETIEPALASVLAQDYPSLELVLIDDRSTDGTGALIDRLAATDARIRAVHIRELPAAWLGKVHALQRGVDVVDGEWILFTDADVHFAPGALKRAVAYSVEQGFDHFSVLPEIVQRSFGVGICVGSAVRALLALARPWEAMDPKSKRGMGAGAFNLVRRAAFERTPGFEWLRLEVADDVGLGLMMKRFGGRPGLALGLGAVIVEWYRSVGDAMRGLEKNGYAQAARFSLLRALVMVLMVPISSGGMFAGFIPVGVPWLPLVSGSACSVFAVAAYRISRVAGTKVWYVLASLPFGDALMAFVIMRATVLGIRRGGLTWRGTVYPTALLREGRRVDM